MRSRYNRDCNYQQRVLRVLMEKSGHLQEQMSDISKEMETLRKSKINAGHKKHCDRNDNAFDGLISRLGIGQVKISELKELPN